jgi:hypothetical protein
MTFVFLLDGIERRLADTGKRIGLRTRIKLIEPHRKLPQIREQHELRARHYRPAMLGDLVQIGARALRREVSELGLADRHSHALDGVETHALQHRPIILLRADRKRRRSAVLADKILRR